MNNSVQRLRLNDKCCQINISSKVFWLQKLLGFRHQTRNYVTMQDIVAILVLRSVYLVSPQQKIVCMQMYKNVYMIRIIKVESSNN